MKTIILVFFVLCLCIAAIWARPKPDDDDPFSTQRHQEAIAAANDRYRESNDRIRESLDESRNRQRETFNGGYYPGGYYYNYLRVFFQPFYNLIG